MVIDQTEIVVSGRAAKTAKLRDEYYEWLRDPQEFLRTLEAMQAEIDLFTFLQEIGDCRPKFSFHVEWESLAVLTITSYEEWWQKQINDKTRNMIRKAQKKGVQVRVVDFHDALVRGIMDIQNESPIRQGRKFLHYDKDFETTKRAHATFLDRSQFIAAYLDNQLIGYIKLFHGANVSSTMQIISKIAHRDKAPTNALLAKAIEICADRNTRYLHYGVWGRASLNDFKKHHGFQPMPVVRYFVPLTFKGKLMLKANLHRSLRKLVPENWVHFAGNLRYRWNTWRYGDKVVPLRS